MIAHPLAGAVLAVLLVVPAAAAQVRPAADPGAARAETGRTRWEALAPQVGLQGAALPGAGDGRDVRLLFLGRGNTLSAVGLDGGSPAPLPVAGTVVHVAVAPTMDLLLYVLAEEREERTAGGEAEKRVVYKLLVSDIAGTSPVLLSDRVGIPNIDRGGGPAFSHCGDPTYPHWAPDGRRILYAGWREADGSVPFYVVNAVDRTERLLLRVPGPTRITSPQPPAQEQMSRNPLLTRWIDDRPPRAGRGMGVQVDPGGGARVGALPGGAGPLIVAWYCSDVRFHPDGRSITWSTDIAPEVQGIWVRPLEGLDPADPASVTTGATRLPYGEQFLWAPSGEQVALARRFSDAGRTGIQVLVAERQGGRIVRELLREDAGGVLGPKVRLLAWSPDSKRIAVYLSHTLRAGTTPGGSIRVYDLSPGAPPAPVEIESGRIPPLSLQPSQFRRAAFTPDGKTLLFVHLTLATTPGLPVASAAIQALALDAAGAAPGAATPGRPPPAPAAPPAPRVIHRQEGSIAAIALVTAPRDIEVPPLPLVVPAAALEGTLKEWLQDRKGEVERHLRVARELTAQVKPLATPTVFDPFPLLEAWHGQHAGILLAERQAREAAEWFFRGLAGAWDRLSDAERAEVESGLEARAWALRRHRTARRVLLREAAAPTAAASSESLDAHLRNLWKATWAAAEIEALARMWGAVSTARLALDGRYDVYEIDDPGRDPPRAAAAEAAQRRHLHAAIDLGIAALLASESQHEAALDARKSRLFAFKDWVAQMQDAARDPSLGRGAARGVVQVLGLGFNLFDVVAGLGADWGKRGIDRALGHAVDRDTKDWLFGAAFHTRAEKIDDELVRSWERTQFKLLLLRFLEARPLPEVRQLARQAAAGTDPAGLPIAPGKIDAADIRALLDDRAFHDVTRGGLLRLLGIALTGFRERCQMELLIARDRTRLIRRDMAAAYRLEQGQDPQTGELTWATILSPMAWADLVTKTLFHMDSWVQRSAAILDKDRQLQAIDRLGRILPGLDFAFESLPESGPLAADHVRLLGVSAPYVQFAVRVREEETARDLHAFWKGLRGLTGALDPSAAVALALRDALPRASAEAEREAETERMQDLEYVDLVYAWDLAGALSLAEWLGQPPAAAPAGPEMARAPPGGADPAGERRRDAGQRRQLYAHRAKVLRDALATQHLKDQAIPIFRNAGDIGVMLAAFRFLGPGPVTAAEARFLGIAIDESFARHVFSAFNPLAMGPRAVVSQAVTEVLVDLGAPYTGEKYEALLNQVVGILADVPLDQLAARVAAVRARVRAQLSGEQVRHGQLDAGRYVADVFSRSLLRATEGYLTLRARWTASPSRPVRASGQRQAAEATHLTRRWLEVEWLDDQARRLRRALTGAVDAVTIRAYLSQRRALKTRVAPPSVEALERLVRDHRGELFDAARGLDIESLRLDLADLWRRAGREERPRLEAVERLLDEERDRRVRLALGEILSVAGAQIEGIILNGTRPGHAEYKGLFSDRDLTLLVKPGVDPAGLRRVITTVFKRHRVVLNAGRAPPSADVEVMIQDFRPGEVRAITSWRDFERWTVELPKDPHRYLSAGGNVWVGLYNHLNGGTVRRGGREGVVVEPSPDPNLLARPPTDPMLAHGLLLDAARFDVLVDAGSVRSTATLAELTGKRAKQVLRAVDAVIWARAPELVARRTPEAARDRGYHRLIVDDARELVRRGVLSPEEYRTVVYLYTMKRGASVAQAFGVDAGSLEAHRGRIENLWVRMDGLMRRAFSETRAAHLDGLARRAGAVNGEPPEIDVLRTVALENRIAAGRIEPDALARLSGLGPDALERMWRQDRAAIELGNRRSIAPPPAREAIAAAAARGATAGDGAAAGAGSPSAGDGAASGAGGGPAAAGAASAAGDGATPTGRDDTAARVRFDDDRRPDEGVKPHDPAPDDAPPAAAPGPETRTSAEEARRPLDLSGAEIGEWVVKLGDRVVAEVKNPGRGALSVHHEVVGYLLGQLLDVPVAFTTWLDDGRRAITRHVEGDPLLFIIEEKDLLSDAPVRAPPGYDRDRVRASYVRYRLLSALLGHFGMKAFDLEVTPDGQLVAMGFGGAEPLPPGNEAPTPQLLLERIRRGLRGKDWPSPGITSDVARQLDLALGVSREEIKAALADIRGRLTLADGSFNEAALEPIARQYGSEARRHLDAWKLTLSLLDGLLDEPGLFRSRDELGRYELVEMGEEYVGENTPQGSARGQRDVRYYDQPGQLEQCCRLHIRDGVVYDRHGNKFDTRGLVTDGHANQVIYVMDASGNFYWAEGRAGVVHHSSLGRGQPVAAAGHLVVEDGKVVHLDNNSGHYKPKRRHLEQAGQRLRELGVSTDGVVKPVQ